MISITIDPSSRRIFRRIVKDFEKKTGRKVEDSVVELTRSSAKQLAHRVPPFGLNAQVGKKFEGSIAKQVDRAIKAGNVGVVSGATAAQMHASARDNKGQVPKGLRTRGKRVKNPISVREKEALIDRKQAAAGSAKGAWIAAGNSLSGKRISGVARWVSRHLLHGSSKILRRGISTEASITNELPYIQRLQSGPMIKAALQIAYRNTLRQMQRILDKP